MQRAAIRFLILISAAAATIGACDSRSVSLSSSLSEYEFEPSSWQVPAGAEIELTLTNDGNLIHDWVLMPREDQVEPPYTVEEWDQAQADFRLAAGETETFTLTAPDEPGEYPVLCTEGGHFDFGMVGTLIVE